MNIEIEDLGKLKLNDLQAKFAEMVGETTRSPNRTYLIRRITEAIAANGHEPAIADDVPILPTASESGGATAIMASESNADDSSSANALVFTATPKLAQLDIRALQALYDETIGRPTSSTNRQYLIWKIREARKGRIPIGPQKNRRAERMPILVLPLRLESELVELIDEAWRRLGLRSRTELFRRSLQTYFAGAGETDLAAHFETAVQS